MTYPAFENDEAELRNFALTSLKNDLLFYTREKEIVLVRLNAGTIQNEETRLKLLRLQSCYNVKLAVVAYALELYGQEVVKLNASVQHAA